MDSTQFDTITKTFSRGFPRRRALTLLAAALGSGMSTLAWTSTAAAPKCGGAGQRCCTKGARCTAGALCNKQRHCKCKKGRRACGRQCIARSGCCTKGRPGCPDGKQCCRGRCISQRDCCHKGRRVPNGGTYQQCGKCLNGEVLAFETPCDVLDPDECHHCDGPGFGGSYQCVPHSDGFSCVNCGTCNGGLCDPRPGWTPCDPFGIGTCCGAGLDCCVTTSGKACKPRLAGCGMCQYQCPVPGGFTCCPWTATSEGCLPGGGGCPTP
jgi:hypothetical protein